MSIVKQRSHPARTCDAHTTHRHRGSTVQQLARRLGTVLAACVVAAVPMVATSPNVQAYNDGACTASYDNCYWNGVSSYWDDYYRKRTSSAWSSTWIWNRDSSYNGSCYWTNTGWTGTPYYLPYAGTGQTNIGYYVQSHSRFNSVTYSGGCPSGQ